MYALLIGRLDISGSMPSERIIAWLHNANGFLPDSGSAAPPYLLHDVSWDCHVDISRHEHLHRHIISSCIDRIWRQRFRLDSFYLPYLLLLQRCQSYRSWCCFKRSLWTLWPRLSQCSLALDKCLVSWLRLDQSTWNEQRGGVVLFVQEAQWSMMVLFQCDQLIYQVIVEMQLYDIVHARTLLTISADSYLLGSRTFRALLFPAVHCHTSQITRLVFSQV